MNAARLFRGGIDTRSSPSQRPGAKPFSRGSGVDEGQRKRGQGAGYSVGRRRILQGAGGLIAAAALTPKDAAAAPAQTPAAPAAGADVTGRLARYMVSARNRALPPNVMLECKHRILDTLGAMVSGARMKPGQMGLQYVRALGGAQEASVVASNFRTTAINAADRKSTRLNSSH